MSTGRMNRGGNPGGLQPASSSLLAAGQAGGRTGGQRGGPTSSSTAATSASYAGASRGAAGGGGGSEWGSPASGRQSVTSALKPQTGGAGGAGAGVNSSPNPYAPAFVSSSASPWSTPGGGGGGGAGGGSSNRYKREPGTGTGGVGTATASGKGPSASGAVRNLFPSGSGEDSKQLLRKSPANWEELASSSDGSSSSHTTGLTNGGAEQHGVGPDGVHPEHWESYHDGQAGGGGGGGGGGGAGGGGGGAPGDTLGHLDTTRNNNSISTNGLQGSPTPTDAQQQQQQQQPADNLNLARVDSKGTDISLSLSALKSGAHPNDISIHMLSLLYDPPVQGCELRPYVSVVDSFGRVSAVNTDEAAQALDFRWFRGQKRVCSNVLGRCSKAATLQCLSCAKLSGQGIPAHETYFCSDKCLRDSWPQHKHLHQQHAIVGGGAVAERTVKEWNYDEDELDSAPSSATSPQQQQQQQQQRELHCQFPALLQNSWEETGAERAYMPSSDDVGRAIRLECSPILSKPAAAAAAAAKTKGKDSPSSSSSPTAASPAATPDVVTSTSTRTSELSLGTVVRIDTGAVIPVPPPPPARTTLYADPSTPIHPANTFRCVCFNVLAQIYATRQVYPYTPIWALAWEYRRGLLLRDILAQHADVVTLQEVQANHFDSFFQPQLSKHGYDGIFKKKTRDAGNDSAGNQMIDGCATFYKRERFALMEQYGIEFNEAARQHTGNRTQLRRLLRGNIALVLVLEELTPPPAAAGASNAASAAHKRNRKRRLCITNTHIFWDPDYPDVKLWQTWVLCQELEKLVLPRNLPLVLCGDFNSLADSSVYELLSQQGVEQGEDVFGPSGDPTGLLPAPHQVAHRLPLLSAYGATCGEPKYTNYTGSFVGVLDYIFFTRTHLRCVACMDVDEESLLREYTALPSPKYPSDHIALATTLEFLDP